MNDKQHPVPYSPKPFSRQLVERISTLEGLHLSADMQSKFDNFDMLGLTGKQRRKQLLAQFDNT